MNVLTKAVWDFVRLGLLAGAIVFASVGIGQESHPASASHTQVLLSYSNVWPSERTMIVVTPDGLPRDVYVWAVNVDNATGVSGYHLEIGFDGSAFTVASFETPLPLWLGTSGRSASCPSPTIETNRVFIDCLSIGSQLGATGTGLLGKLTIQPGSGLAGSALDLTGTFLIDTPPPPDFVLSHIPVSLLSSYVAYLECADVNGDGLVDLPNDILGIIDHWQWSPNFPAGPGGGPNPDWDGARVYDINNDNIVDLVNDILGAIDQWQLNCYQTPPP